MIAARTLAGDVAAELERLSAHGEVWTLLPDAEAEIARHAEHRGSTELTEPGNYVQLSCAAASCSPLDEFGEREMGTAVRIAERAYVACCAGHESGLAHVEPCTAPWQEQRWVAQARGRAAFRFSSSCPTCIQLNAQRAQLTLERLVEIGALKAIGD